MKNLFHHISNVFYPNICFHCSSSIGVNRRYLCEHCFSLLDEKLLKEKKNEKLHILFENEGPIVSLITHFKKGQPYISELLAPLLIERWSKLDWPYPERINFVRDNFFSNWKRGYDPNQLLAKNVSKIFKVAYSSKLLQNSTKATYVIIPEYNDEMLKKLSNDIDKMSIFF